MDADRPDGVRRRGDERMALRVLRHDDAPETRCVRRSRDHHGNRSERDKRKNFLHWVFSLSLPGWAAVHGRTPLTPRLISAARLAGSLPRLPSLDRGPTRLRIARYPLRNWSFCAQEHPHRRLRPSRLRCRRTAARAWFVLREDEAELVLLCVPDRAISEVARTIPPGPWIAHVSGATPLAALDPHERRFGLHPLQSFSRARGPEQLDGAYAAVTAETRRGARGSASGSRASSVSIRSGSPTRSAPSTTPGQPSRRTSSSRSIVRPPTWSRLPARRPRRSSRSCGA